MKKFIITLQLQQQGIFKSEDLLSRFFRISIEMCVELCYRTLNDPVRIICGVVGFSGVSLQSINPTLARAKCYHTMDAFVRLVVVLVRFSGESTNNVTKINLVNKVMFYQIICCCVIFVVAIIRCWVLLLMCWCKIMRSTQQNFISCHIIDSSLCY